MLNFQILLAPVVALMSLAFLFSMVLRKFHGSKYEPLAFGTLFGSAVVIGMVNPIVLGEGVIFDTRTLLTGAAVAFAGPIAGLITVIIGIACRILIGGAGVTSGVIGLMLAYGLAVVWVRYLRGKIANPVIQDLGFGIFITSSILAIFALPFEMALGIFLKILPTLLICNGLGLVALGFVFRRERMYFQAARALEEHARTDPLTHLLNRRGLDAAFDTRKFDTQNGHALFYFDIDNFKAINDSFGHDAGDAALAIIAARLKNSLREEAVFARHGGDEFSIYIPDLNAGDVEGIGQRLCSLVASEPIESNGVSFDVSISVGAYWSRVACSLKEMIRQADSQLLLAKNKGKNLAQVAYSATGIDAVAA